MKRIIIVLTVCLIAISCKPQTVSWWNNLGLDSIYVSDDEPGDEKFLNFVIPDIGTWQLERPFGVGPSTPEGTWHISPTGSDASGDGSFENPWWTLNKVWTVLAAGDTVYCRDGTYNWTAEQDLTGVNGTISDTIKIWAYPNEQPVFRKGATIGVSSPAQMVHLEADYTWWKGIEIKDFTQESAHVWNAMRVDNSDNNIFEQMNMHHCGSGMVFKGTSDSNLVLNSDFHHNQDPLNSYGNADGLQFFQVTGDSNYVMGCRFWSNSDDGNDNYETEGRVIYDSCWSWHNGYIPDTYTAGGNGAGFKLGLNDVADNTDTLRIIRNSIAFNNKQYGFGADQLNANVKIFNNFAYRNGNLLGIWGSGFEFKDEAVPTAEINWHIRNNLSWDNLATHDIDNTTNVSNNSWNVGSLDANDFVTGSLADTVSLDDARKTGGWLPDIILGHLTSGSNMIDAGQDVGISYNGVAPDVSAHESDY